MTCMEGNLVLGWCETENNWGNGAQLQNSIYKLKIKALDNQLYCTYYTRQLATVLLNILRVKNLCEWAKSAKNLTLCDLTNAFWQGSCVVTRFCGFYCCELTNHRKVRKCLMLAKHSYTVHTAACSAIFLHIHENGSVFAYYNVFIVHLNGNGAFYANGTFYGWVL